MADMLKNGMSWLESQRKNHFSSPVIYRRGEDFTELSATIGKTIFKVEDEYGRVVHYESRDYLISNADLIIGGENILPEVDDEIIENGHIYEVMAPANEPEWRYSDTHRQTLRIHTKHTGEE